MSKGYASSTTADSSDEEAEQRRFVLHVWHPRINGDKTHVRHYYNTESAAVAALEGHTKGYVTTYGDGFLVRYKGPDTYWKLIAGNWKE